MQKVPNHEFINNTGQYGMNPGQMHMEDYQQQELANHYPHGPQAPLRPNSLELSTSYGQDLAYSRMLASPTTNYNLPQHPPSYIEHPQYTQYQPPPPYSATLEPLSSQQQTPVRQNSRAGIMTSRPSHPPPEPPSASGSGSSTPVPTSSQNGTPKMMGGQGRESLPPPPPPPNEILSNGPLPAHVIHKVAPMQSRCSTPGSPGSMNSTPTHHHHLQQLSSQGRGSSELPEQETPDSMDLPPPPPTPDKDFAKSSADDSMPSPPPPPSSIGSPGSTPPLGSMPVPPPPPPPPPPPLPVIGNGTFLANGDVGNSKTISIDPSLPATGTSQPLDPAFTNSPKTNPAMKIPESEGRPRMHGQLPPFHDARSDLLAAIREGKTKHETIHSLCEFEKHCLSADWIFQVSSCVKWRTASRKKWRSTRRLTMWLPSWPEEWPWNSPIRTRHLRANMTMKLGTTMVVRESL